MKVGINYAWKNYGWDFGLPPRSAAGVAWGPRAAFRDRIDEDLAEFVRMGLFCVRWFLLGDGTTYGVGAKAPHPDAAQPAQWRFDEIPALSPEFLEDYAYLLSRCAHHGIQILPSLIDFHFCFPGLVVPGTDGIVKSGRGDVVYDPRKRALFLQRVLRPLLEVSAQHRATVYAFEVINEPEWCTQTAALHVDAWTPQKTIPLERMRAFVAESAAEINRAGFLSTVGFALHPSVASWDSPALHLTLHQFHYYAEPAELPPHTFHPSWPLIVGEIATARHRLWPDLPTNQDLITRLAHLKRLRYPVVFLWSANRTEEAPTNDKQGPVVDFSPATRARIAQFLAGDAPLPMGRP